MKKLSYLFLLLFLASMIVSCNEDPTSDFIESVENSSNLAVFFDATANLSGVADGRTIDTNLPVGVTGPTATELEGDVTVTISVDPSSTAVEGTHFTFGSKQVTLTEQGKYIGIIPITMLTAGIATPLASNPTVVLNVESVTASGKVIASGKPLNISMLYLCPSDLAGSYTVTQRFVSSTQGIDQTTTFADELVQTGDGAYRTSRVGHWAAATLGGTPGMDLIDVCNQITIPSQNLVNLYSNIVAGVEGSSSVDPATGIITLEYTVCATYCREYFETYVPQ